MLADFLKFFGFFFSCVWEGGGSQCSPCFHYTFIHACYEDIAVLIFVKKNVPELSKIPNKTSI